MTTGPTVYELIMQLDATNSEYKRQVDDLPKNYVRGSAVFKQAAEQLKINHQNQTQTLKNLIENELIKLEAKADVDEHYQDALSQPTAEEIEEGFKVVDMINKTKDSISDQTLKALLLRVKDLDQLAVINDVINATNDSDLKFMMKQHLTELDSATNERKNTRQTIEDFRNAMRVAGDTLTFNVLSLATQLSEV